jgi:hypothetical protein
MSGKLSHPLKQREKGLMHYTVPVEQEETEEDVTVEITDLGLPDQRENSLLLALAPTLLEWQRSPKTRQWVRWISRAGIALLLIILFSLNAGFSLLIMKSLHASVEHIM